MGDHLIKLGEKQENQREAPPVVESKEESDQRREVERILSNPQLKAVLEDPAMRDVLKECQLPGMLVKYMRHPVYGPKLQLMKEAGLIQIHN